MWLIKSKDEIISDRKKRVKEHIALMSIMYPIFLVFAVIMSKFGCNGHSIHQAESSWRQVYNNAIVSVPYFIGLYFIVIIASVIGVYFEDPQLMCERCSKMKTKHGSDICSCGGKYIDLRHYKWME